MSLICSAFIAVKKGFADVHMDFKEITYLNIICKSYNISLNRILDCSADSKCPIYDMKVDDNIHGLRK